MQIPNPERGQPFPLVALPAGTFEPLLVKEVERSRRYYRGFGLLCIRPRTQTGETTTASSGPPLRERDRETAAPPAAGWQEAIARSVRRADVVASAPQGAVYVLLPETSPSGMPAVAQRLAEALQPGAPADHPGGAPVIAQVSFPRDGETAEELLSALADALD